ESRHHYHGNVHGREHVYRHASHGGDAHYCDDQANHDNEVRISDRESWHQRSFSAVIVVIFGLTCWPGCRAERFPITTRSPSRSPDRISTRLEVSSPRDTLRTSTCPSGVTSRTRPVAAASSLSTAETGTARASYRRSSVRLTSAYIPGIRMRLGLGTSTSVSMVRVDGCTLPAKRATFPGKTRLSDGTFTSTPPPTRTLGATDSGTGSMSRSRLFCDN